MVRRLIALLVTLLISSILTISPTSASSSRVVITQVEAGGPSALTSASLMEYISIYNNSDHDIEVTNWCLINKTSSSVGCFIASDSSVHYWLKSYTYATVSSVKFSENYNIKTDITYTPTNNISGSITASADSISLVDANSTLIDNASWSTSLTGGHLLQRNLSLDPNVYIDSGVLSDFTNTTTLNIRNSGLYEQIILVDFCKNIEGIQLTMPNGYDLDANSDCQIDVCLNLLGLQINIPTGMYKNALDECVHIDVCLNIAGAQSMLPTGYYEDEFNNCYVITASLLITEILPNANGADSNNEFIEIYNPTDTSIDLSFYKLGIGIDTLRFYSIPIGSIVSAKSYYVLYNKDLNFTLINSSSQVSLSSIDGQFIYSTDIYMNPKEGYSWNLLSGLWQYSNQATPGYENLDSIIIDPEVEQSKNCAANQYYSIETGRCRLTTTKSSKLVPCKDGEYRSEETNRCRSVLGATTVNTECPEGQYRNPDTNRCRKNVEVSKAEYPNNSFLKIDSGNSGKLILLGVFISTSAYGIWEWRYEMSFMIKKFKKLYKKTK